MAKAGTKVVRAPRRKSITGVNISPDARVSLYAQARYLPREFKAKAALLLPFTTYFQDPFVAKTDPRMAIDEGVMVPWYPSPIIDVSGRLRLARPRNSASVSHSDSAGGSSSGPDIRIEAGSDCSTS